MIPLNGAVISALGICLNDTLIIDFNSPIVRIILLFICIYFLVSCFIHFINFLRSKL